MTARVARVLTRLYSSSWRTRYGSEFEAMLQTFPATPRVVIDMLPGALWSWRNTPAMTVFVALALVVAASVLWHHTNTLGVAAKPHMRGVVVASACRSYSSAAANGWIASSRCLN